MIDYVCCARAGAAMSDPAEPRMYAIVVKGPLLRFTANVLSYYASRAKDTVVIFSHNNGSCFTPVRAAVLRGLERRFAPNLASTIHPMPARRGLNHRNVQREACYHGVRLAIQAFRAQCTTLMPVTPPADTRPAAYDLHAESGTQIS